MVKSIKKASVEVKLSSTTNNKDIKCLDIVGTGGDGADTINISTAAAILCAASGNRYYIYVIYIKYICYIFRSSYMNDTRNM